MARPMMGAVPLLPPLTGSRVLTSWVADPFGIVLAVLLLAGYASAVRVVRRRGGSWPMWRTLLFILLGAGSLVLVTCGVPGAYRGSLLWVGGSQAAALSALVPLGLALGDPVGLMRAAGGPLSARVDRWLRSLPARALMFPMLSSVLAVGTLVLVFLTPYYAASVRSLPVRELLYAHLLLTGSLFILPLLGEELLPAWCTYPVRALFGFVDGLLDAVPGALLIALPTVVTHGVPSLLSRGWGPDPLTDQHYAGGALLIVGEGIGLPFLGVLLIGWLREDAREARAVDARLDAEALRGAAARDAGTVVPQRDRPWWENDPRFAGRYPRRPPPAGQHDGERH